MTIREPACWVIGMRILILGGTAWLGGEVAQVALERGHDVTCLARGESGQAPPGVHMVAADRSSAAAYGLVADQDWDGVVDVSWQPGFVRGAVAALADRAGTWVYVSSGSVYAAHGTPGADEGAALLPALEGDVADRESYGEAKVACEQAVLAAVGAAPATTPTAPATGRCASPTRPPRTARSSSRTPRTWAPRSSTCATWPGGWWSRWSRSGP